MVTHVDVPPPRKDECIAALKSLVADSRKEAGGVRFEVFQQGNRPNHFSVVESLEKPEGLRRPHHGGAHQAIPRPAHADVGGALYDERTYKAL